MTTLALILAVLLLSVGVYVLGNAWRGHDDSRVAQRLRAVVSADGFTPPVFAEPGPFARRMRQAGVGLSRPGVAIAAGVYLGGAAVAWLASPWGWPAAVVWALLVPVAVAAWFDLRWRRRKELLLRQLPGFLDHLIRGMATGSNLHASFVVAAEEAPLPLREVLLQVSRAIELGDGLEASLQRAAKAYGMYELRLLAVGLGVNARYGGSVKTLLENITQMIRKRERWRREIRALTGETRVTAVVMALVPLLIAGYVTWTNPEYMQAFWDSTGGRIALFVALFLQVGGVLALWRMLRSI